MAGIVGADDADRYDVVIDNEIIGFANCSTTTWSVVERGADNTVAAAHVVGSVVSQDLTKGGLDRLVAVQEGGVLAAVGRVLNFAGGAVVTQVGNVIQVVVSGFTNPMTTRGDLIVENAAPAAARLAVGAANSVLHSDGTDPAWTTAPTLAGELTATDLKASGVTGAASSVRLIGGNASGAPTTGAHLQRDFAVDTDGSLWVCTVSGTPGTWVQVSGSGGALSALTDVNLGSLTDGDVLTYDSGSSLWINAASAGGPPSGSAGGDLASTYPNPSVVALQGYPLPVFSLNNGFLKLDATHGNLELVAFGTLSNTVTQGNDARLSDTRKPKVHHNIHEPGDGVSVDGTTGMIDASDRIDWDGTIHGMGLNADRPSADDTNLGCLWFETDTDGGTLYRSNGTTWDAITLGLGSSSPPSGSAGGDLSGTFPSPDVSGLQNDALPSTINNGFLKRTSTDSGWEQVAYGSAANTVTQGNDSRLTNARTPTSHHATHELGGTDMLEVETFIIEDVASARPAASNTGLTDNEGFLFWASDTQILYRSNGTTWEQVALGVGDSAPPSGTASGDLDLNYPDPEVVGLQGDALASTTSNGFVKRNSANTAWESVGFGSSADTVTQGNDSRLSNSRTPTTHASTHLPAGSDPIDWTGRIHPADVLANLPAASSGNAGTLYYSTDTFVLYRSDGSAWTAITGAIGGSAPPSGSAGGDLSGTYPNPTVAKLNGEALPSFGANGFIKQNAGNTALESVAYGSAANTVTQGNDSRLSDSRAPNGSAGGDLTGSYPNPTLATSGVTAATYGDATHVAQITLDAKGRATSASPVAIQPMVASGASHAAGLVPDPGASSGSTKFLREDATFAVPPGTGLTSAYTEVDDQGTALTARSQLNFVGNGVIADDSGGVTRVRIHDLATMLYEDDDFIVGGAGSSTTGQLGWVVAAGTGGSFTIVAGEAGRPGIVRINGSTSANQLSYIAGHGTFVHLLPADTFDLLFAMRPTDVDNLTTIRVGLADNPAGNPPTNGIYIEGLSSDFASSVMSWQGVTRSGASQNRTAALATTAANAWVTFRVRRVDSTHVGFTVNGGTEVQATSTIPTAALGIFWHILSTSGSNARHLDCDYVSILVTGLSR